MTRIHKTLQNILETRSFELLEPFKQKKAWDKLSHEDRILLAKLLVLQGSEQLEVGDQRVLQNFEIASEVSNEDQEILYQQGHILGACKDNIRCLSIANQIFQKILTINPTSLSVLFEQANVLTEIGLFESDSNYFHESHQNYEKMVHLIKDEHTFDLKEFYWKWGLSLTYLGKLSGEPFDFHQALEKFRTVVDENSSQFLIDYANCYGDLAFILDRPDYYLEALKLFNLAISMGSTDAEVYYLQGSCLLRLMEYSYDEKLSMEAQMSFSKVAECDPNYPHLWLKWGLLDMCEGKAKQDLKKIETSIEKLIKAHELEPGDAQILYSLGEAELFLGVQEEKLELIQTARIHIVNSLQIQDDNSHVWYLYGACLNELGRYFEAEEYYHQGIEKFQYGLSLDRQNPLLWYGMALAHFSLGELTQQHAMYEKAVRFCSKVIEFGGGSFAQFWNDWGVSLMKLGELTEQTSLIEMAIEKFERALKHPLQNVREEVDLEWVYNYGCAFDLLGDMNEEATHYEKAIQILSQILVIDPEYIQARHSLALAMSHFAEATSDIDTYNKAIEHFQYLLNQDPEDDAVHLDFGIALTNLTLLIHDYHHSDESLVAYRLAESHLVQAIALGNTQAYYQLAGLNSIVGRYDFVMHYLQKAHTFDVLPAIEDLLHDDWLEGVRQIPAFKQFINELSLKQSMDDK